ncbi:MAG: ubiquinol-cytochrome c reductase iron-sulfur subunit [Rhodospirillales bacterium]|jgi:ubiquinol-cytochrome c reductase iron-sulfur subunit|nr:ubiquinol-cytochrome c reductase iron-sulfur subunit [Rhodospirillaceae bacterium]MDP6429585.1 ubiquinol-cytochrome c reductase iron-sulfur subunit [Rhodospirillales bacterium]MDP6643882.1 ubiquinol-cytochrome c reductase iron-sulfur subunit [Rhodospirillales bacterium]MDP6843643.1 ubiquinol-cytochrome c reductase iron-sulfur subunit [Rhodospirillales bacterium]|tara:strand:+ start:311 stop:865 length:555 start_codon:yes stop_codon:yes gene_type:complete
MAETASTTHDGSEDEESRRDFLLISTVAVGTIGTALAAWPFIDQMNPSRDVLALASTEIDLSPIEEGQSITVVWRGKPVFVRKRTAKEIETAKNDDSAVMKHHETDADRVQKPEWLVQIGICTHLGCIPLGQKASDPKGEFGGWFCPCHGSHYDTSGRIRKGPAPKNLPIPPYAFTSDTAIRIG